MKKNLKNRELKLDVVEKIYSRIIISKDLVLEINPEFEDFEKLKSDLNEIGYASEI